MNTNGSPLAGAPNACEPAEDELVRVLDAYLAEVDAGRAPDPERLIAAHPRIADRLPDCLGVFGLAEHLAGDPEGDRPQEYGPGPDARIGDFRILRQIGRGGMGVVYEAEQVSLGRRVALKVMPFAAALDPKQLQRFQLEAHAAACLHHTNIVPVHAVGIERGVPYYAMQFIEGQSLAEIIRDLRHSEGRGPDDGDVPEPADMSTSTLAAELLTGRFGSRLTSQGSEGPATAPLIHRSPKPRAGETPREVARQSSPPPDPSTPSRPSTRTRDYVLNVARLGRQAAEALDHAHTRGILHRDIKPANLLLDPGGHLWVADFGLARVQGNPGLTLTGDLLGTLRYMSPEQALAKWVVIDGRTDVYSLGATLYELLTLRPAFEGKDRAEILRWIAEREPVPLRTLNAAVPIDLETIVGTAMAKEPAGRYASASELAEDLRNFLEDRPIRARRPSLADRAAKWVRRHRSTVAMAALAALVVIAALGAAGINWAIRRAATHRVVAAALDESAAWQEKRRLPEALSAARRADELVEAGAADAALRRRVRARRDDLQLLTRLEDARQASVVENGNYARGRNFDRLYREVFREFGLDLEALTPEDAAARLRGTTVAAELAATVDHWAFVLQRGYAASRPGVGGQHLLRVARAIDPDPWRNRLRGLIEAPERQALIDLASSDGAFASPPLSLFVLGQALESKEAPDQAQALLREAQRRYPDDFWLNTYLILLLRTAQPPRPEERVRFATAALALRPQSSGARRNLGFALIEQGALDEAIACLKEVVRLGPVDTADPEYHSRVHENLGVALSRKGALGEAMPFLVEAVRLNPRNADARRNLLFAQLNARAWDEALASVREALRLKPDDVDAHIGLGDIHQAKGRLDDAIACYQEAIRLHPDFAKAHFKLGVLLLDQGRLDEAIACFNEAIRLKPDFGCAYSKLGISLLNIALKEQANLDEAIARCREAVRLGPPDHADHHDELGIALASAGRLDEAVSCYDEAIRLKPDYAQPHNNLAWLLATSPDPRLRNPARAVELARKAVEQVPTEGAFWNTLGVAEYYAGSWDQAVEALTRSVELTSGGSPADWFFLALAHERRGERDQARSWYDKAVAWMDRNKSQDGELLRFRAEAEERLGVKRPQSGDGDAAP